MPASLPLELWRLIMKDVVHIRGALETVMTTQFEWLEWRYNEGEKYAESMANRLSLVQVCKAWYLPALELLYEDIRPRSLEHMAILRVHLDESRRIQSGSPLGLGWWTKRFDAPLKGVFHNSDINSLLAHFPNLLIFRSLNCDSPISNPDLPLPKLRWTNLPIDAHSDLDTVYFMSLLDYKYLFSKATSLEVIFFEEEVSAEAPSTLRDFSFPNIRHLSMNFLFCDDSPEIDPFLDRYGQQLLSLHIDCTQSYLRIEQLLCKTPNLRELIFIPRTYEDHCGDTTFPNVTHIGIKGTYSHWESAVRNTFFNPSRFCNVKSIRMVDNAFPTSHSPSLIAWYQGERRAGVLYEDAMGNSFQPV